MSKVIDQSIVHIIKSINTPTILRSLDTPITLKSIAENTLLRTTEESIKILKTGISGPAGPAGAPGGEDEVALEKRVDFNTDNTIIYKGEALPGTLDSGSVWRIKKITIAADNDVREMWANGNSNYDKVWNSRAGYTYTQET